MATKKVTDAQILRALRRHGTIRRSARALKIDESTLRQRLSTDPLRSEWRQARAADAEMDLAGLYADVAEAKRVLKQLMRVGGPQDSVRLAAAQRILDAAAKMREADRAASEAKNAGWEIPEFPVQRGTTTTTADAPPPGTEPDEE